VLLLCVVAFALGWGPGAGSVLGFGAGLALDLVPPTDSAVGQWAFVLCVVGYLSGLVRRAGEGSVFVPLAVVAAASAGSTLLYAAMAGLIGDPRVTWPPRSPYVPTGVLYAVILSPFVVSAVLALARRVYGPGAMTRAGR
jgi:rod shape-determining protein MreD